MTRKFTGLLATLLTGILWVTGGAGAQSQLEQTPPGRMLQRQIAEMRLFVPIYAE